MTRRGSSLERKFIILAGYGPRLPIKREPANPLGWNDLRARLRVPGALRGLIFLALIFLFLSTCSIFTPMTETSFNQDTPVENTAKVLFWIIPTEYNGIGIDEAWNGKKRNRIPLITIPAGLAEITWDASFSSQSSHAGGLYVHEVDKSGQKFKFNFEAGKEYTINAEFRKAEKSRSGYDSYLIIYDKLPINKKKPNSLLNIFPKSSKVFEKFNFNTIEG